MAGFGEIFARDWLGPFFGFVSIRTPRTNSAAPQFNTAGVGLRHAGGSQRGGAQDVPSHPAAKTLMETAVKSTEL